MESRIRRRVLWLVSGLGAYLFFLVFFFWKYIPFAKNFQRILLPVIVLTCLVTAINAKRGIILFTFLFPLINNLPYFFKIYENVPHAPTALVLFLFFFLGLLIHNLFKPTISRGEYRGSIFPPLGAFLVIILVSGALTLFRFANFFPFSTSGIYELMVNVNGVRAGGAIMSVFFSCLNYATGILFFLVIWPLAKSQKFRTKLLMAISCSAGLSLAFGLVQKYHSPGLGNTPFWIDLHQINATFKDPNSFGAFVSAVVPLFLGMAFSFPKKYWKYLSGILLLLSLLIFPSIGSRGSLLGLAAALVCFCLLSWLKNPLPSKKKFLGAGVSFLLVILVLLSVFFLAPETKLSQRLRSSLDWFSGKVSAEQLFSPRFHYWQAALQMTRDFPLSGVGVGAYIIELPNYSRKMGLPTKDTDSALNYIVQIGSELGLVGIFTILWILAIILRQIRRNWRTITPDDPDRFILIGALSGLAAFAVNFLFQTYIGSFEVKYLFWLLAAVVISLPHKEGESEPQQAAPRKSGRLLKILAVLGVSFYGLVHGLNSWHSLSIKSRTEIFSLSQDFGFYEWEQDAEGNAFRWTKKTAGLAVENLGPRMIIPLRASHPDLEKNPVIVRVYLANANFKRERLLNEILISQKSWVDFACPTQSFDRKKIRLVFDMSRTWRPAKSLGTPDPRALGIAIGREAFVYPEEIDRQQIRFSEVIPLNKWEGPAGNILGKNGVSHVPFTAKGGNVALRLWALGTKAYDIGPYLLLRLDGEIIGKTSLSEERWRGIIFQKTLTAGPHVFSVEFMNDVYHPKTKQDRNVFLGDFEILYLSPDIKSLEKSHRMGNNLNLVVFLLDAARRDHFSCYGYHRQTTPNIDKLSEKSVIFDNAVSESSFTFASLAALMTGQYPPQTGLLETKRLEDSTKLLADMARDQGYRTLAYSESPFFGYEFGFDRSFDKFIEKFPFEYFLKTLRHQSPPFRSEPGIRDVLDWMNKGTGPFFAFLHILRPHNPYLAPEPYFGRFGGTSKTRALGTTDSLLDFDEGLKKIGPSEIAAIKDLYDENLAYGDFLFGLLIQGLEGRHLLEKTIVVVLSDHGEAFLEHGRLLHYTTVYDEMIRIPLIFYWPGMTKGRRPQMPVQLSDVTATLMEVMGENPPHGYSGGISLVRYLRSGQTNGNRLTFSWAGEKYNRIAVRSLQHKLIFSVQNGSPVFPSEIYSLKIDPQEKYAISAVGSDVAQDLTAAFRLSFPIDRISHGSKIPPDKEISQATLKKLRSLGYLR